MFERITLVFKAMINALLGKVEDPQMMLDQTYAELQSELIKTREQLAVALATEAQLKVQIEKLERKNLPAEELKEKLKQVQAEIAKLRRKISDLENQVGRAYTKKQVLIARDKASGAALLVAEEILVAKAITEDGATFDREIAPAPNRTRLEAPLWLLIASGLIILLIWLIAH